MMHYSLCCWPLALSFARGTPDLQELRGYSREWTLWLERAERFATLRVLQDSAAHGHPPCSAQERKRWFAVHGAALKQQVLGMATVAPADVVEKLNKVKAERLFGVPARAFTSVADALDWLSPLLAAGLPALDVQSLNARVLQQCNKTGDKPGNPLQPRKNPCKINPL